MDGSEAHCSKLSENCRNSHNLSFTKENAVLTDPQSPECRDNFKEFEVVSILTINAVCFTHKF